MNYASFWKRAAAFIIDNIIYSIIASVLANIIGLMIGIGMGLSGVAKPDEASLSTVLTGAVVGLIVQLVVYIFYYVWPESTSWQATIGKRMLGLKVTDLNGQRLSFLRSLGRYAGMILSGITLCIGYLMCFWTEKRQCLHDLLANCLVMDTKPEEKQGCAVAIAIGFVVFFVFLIAGIVAAIALPQYVMAMERAHMAQAYSVLQDAKNAQQIYMTDNRTPATGWDQLGIRFNCSVQADSKMCVAKDFTYELAGQSIVARRTGTANPYTMTIDLNGKLTCQTTDNLTRRRCEELASR